MIRLAGRVLQGLDEFMLRTGHLKVLCNVAIEYSASRVRLEREVAAFLTAQVDVGPQDLPHLGEYLDAKNLCPKADGDDITEYRYPTLRVSSVEGKPRVFAIDGAPVRVWRQDAYLASGSVVSKVGAVTTTAKAGGKTGLSHIFDWAELCGLVSRAGQLSIAARLLPRINGQTDGMLWQTNPYELGPEKLLIAFSLFQEDMDVLSRLVVQLSETEFPLKKRTAMQMFSSLVERLVDESESASYLGSRQQSQISELARDLEQAARRSRTTVATHSTTWHRVSSRLESLVDFGFLTKRAAAKYEYTYWPAPSLAAAAESLRNAEDGAQWLDQNFAQAVLAQESNTETIDVDEYATQLFQLLGRPRAALHIDSLCLAILATAASRGIYLSLGRCRSAMEEFARKRPDRARLARGTSGQRAEFVNLT